MSIQTEIDELDVLIQAAAAGPSAASGDAGSMTARPLDELVRYRKYLAGLLAVDGSSAQGGSRSGWGMCRPARAVPPGGS